MAFGGACVRLCYVLLAMYVETHFGAEGVSRGGWLLGNDWSSCVNDFSEVSIPTPLRQRQSVPFLYF